MKIVPDHVYETSRLKANIRELMSSSEANEYSDCIRISRKDLENLKGQNRRNRSAKREESQYKQN